MKDRFKKAMCQAVVILCLSVVLGMGVNSFSRNGINPFRQPAAHATTMAEIRRISIEEAQKTVGSGIPLLDARSKEDFTEGHIPGAIALPYYEMGSYLDRVLPLLSTKQAIMIYCSEASCLDSELLAGEMYGMGYTRLLVFKDGFKAWAAAGLPTESEAP